VAAAEKAAGARVAAEQALAATMAGAVVAVAAAAPLERAPRM